jgi:hypothetical protein
MPTAAKLVSAILIAALGYFVADLIAQHLPQETDEGYFREVSALLGILVGWRFLGSRSGGGTSSGIGLGLTAALTLLVWGLVVFSGYEMLIRSLRKSYKGPIEGLQDMVAIAIDNLIYLQFIDVASALVVGGILAGIIADRTARRWS